MWVILYFAQLPGQYQLFGTLFMLKQVAPTSLNIPSLRIGDKN